MVKIVQTEADKMTINGKHIYIDPNGKWVTTQELTQYESDAFHSHIKAISEGE